MNISVYTVYLNISVSSVYMNLSVSSDINLSVSSDINLSVSSVYMNHCFRSDIIIIIALLGNIM